MEVIEIPLDQLREALWNPNTMSDEDFDRLRESIARYNLVQNLVVRRGSEGTYEVISGNQRLKVLREAGRKTAACVVVNVSDAQARLLAQALNGLHGEDDLSKKADVVRGILAELPESEVLKLLPETTVSLRSLAALGDMDLAQHLQAWQAAQAARLHHLAFQLTASQLETVEEALEKAMAGITKTADNPNRRGLALHKLCLEYIQQKGAV